MDERIPTFIRRKIRVTPDGCWIWTGVLHYRGYGRSNNRYIHILAWASVNGPVPDGKQLDHLCHTRDKTCRGGNSCPHRACCNPDHLEPVTNRTNQRRGRSPSGINAQKLRCVRGHEFTPDNTYNPRSRPHVRQCRECARARSRRRSQARSRRTVAA